MPGLGWGQRDETTPLERDVMKARAQSQMGDSKGTKKTLKRVAKRITREANQIGRDIARSNRTSDDEPPRHAR